MTTCRACGMQMGDVCHPCEADIKEINETMKPEPPWTYSTLLEMCVPFWKYGPEEPQVIITIYNAEGIEI